MTTDPHEESEKLAMQAEMALRQGEPETAKRFYSQAAQLEEQAFNTIDPKSSRTRGVLAVSTAALWYKGDELDRSEVFACTRVAEGTFPDFAKGQLHQIIESVWAKRGLQHDRKRMLDEHLLVSLRGGSSVATGAVPFGMALETIEGIRKLLYRASEWLSKAPFRTGGPPPPAILAACQPILTAPEAGSFRFGVRFVEPVEPDIFEKLPTVEQLSSFFLRLLDALAPRIGHPSETIDHLVPDRQYQDAFLKLVRNFAPDGKTLRELEFAELAPRSSRVVTLHSGTRNVIYERLLTIKPTKGEVIILEGVLRAVDLDKRWLQIDTPDRPPTKVSFKSKSDMLDDVVGPMMNRDVVVRTAFTKNAYKLLDIELDTGEPEPPT